MWTYHQANGELHDKAGRIVAIGYSGAGEGVNNPELEQVHQVGPIPVGGYLICPPRDDPHTGPYTLTLIPDPGNQMFDRSNFAIHGNSIEKPGRASKGCIVLPLATRRLVWNSGDHRLQVVRDVEEFA